MLLIFLFLCNIFLAHSDAVVVSFYLSILYAVWEARNQLVFSGIQPCEKILARASFHGSSHPSVRQVQVPSQVLASAWKWPREDMVNVNFDAYVILHVEGLSFVARDHSEKVYIGCRFCISFRCSGSFACGGDCVSVGYIIDLCFRQVCFETDYLQLFDAWRRSRTGCSYFIYVISDCRDLVSAFVSLDLSFLLSAILVTVLWTI